MHALCAAWYTLFSVQGDGAQELAAVCEAPPAGSRTRGGAVHACQCVVACSPTPHLSDTCPSLLSPLERFSALSTRNACRLCCIPGHPLCWLQRYTPRRRLPCFQADNVIIGQLPKAQHRSELTCRAVPENTAGHAQYAVTLAGQGRQRQTLLPGPLLALDGCPALHTGQGGSNTQPRVHLRSIEKGRHAWHNVRAPPQSPHADTARGTSRPASGHELGTRPDARSAQECASAPRARSSSGSGDRAAAVSAPVRPDCASRRRARALHARPAGPAGRRAQSTSSARYAVARSARRSSRPSASARVAAWPVLSAMRSSTVAKSASTASARARRAFALQALRLGARRAGRAAPPCSTQRRGAAQHARQYVERTPSAAAHARLSCTGAARKTLVLHRRRVDRLQRQPAAGGPARSGHLARRRRAGQPGRAARPARPPRPPPQAILRRPPPSTPQALRAGRARGRPRRGSAAPARAPGGCRQGPRQGLRRRPRRAPAPPRRRPPRRRGRRQAERRRRRGCRRRAAPGYQLTWPARPPLSRSRPLQPRRAQVRWPARSRRQLDRPSLLQQRCWQWGQRVGRLAPPAPRSPAAPRARLWL